MPRYFAFLRAINVGGHTVKMDHLRTLFGAIGLRDVQTFIASGNVIFDSPARNAAALEEKIERHLKQSLGYEVGTYLRSTGELAEIARYQPFAPMDLVAGSALSIVFMKTAPGAAVRQALSDMQTEIDVFRSYQREIYWLSRSRISDSPAAPLLGKVLGRSGTMRNVTTVRRLAAKYANQ